MKKEILKRALLGAPLGITIGYCITIVLSLLYGNGDYIACMEEFTQRWGNESLAVCIQAGLCAILGGCFGGCSIIWQTEWSLCKQSAVYFFITALVMMPIAYWTNWMHHSLGGFLLYFAIFFAIFLFIWFIQWLLWRKQIRTINKQFLRKRT